MIFCDNGHAFHLNNKNKHAYFRVNVRVNNVLIEQHVLSQLNPPYVLLQEHL